MDDMDLTRGLPALIDTVKGEQGWTDQQVADEATRRGHSLTRGGVQRARTSPSVTRIDRASVETWAAALRVPQGVVVQAMLVSAGWREQVDPAEEMQLLLAQLVPDPSARAVASAAVMAAREVGGDERSAAPKTEAGDTPAPKTTVLRAPNGGVTTTQAIRTRVRREARLREGLSVPDGGPAAQRDKHLAKADEAARAGLPERAAYHRVYAEAWETEADALANPGRPAEFLSERDDELPDFTQLAARDRGRVSDAERLAQQQDDEGETP